MLLPLSVYGRRPGTASAAAERPGISVRPRTAGSWGPGPQPTDVKAPRWDARLFAIPHVFEGTADKGTTLRGAYERGELPCTIKHGARSKIDWKMPVEKIDVARLLPIFCDGLREKVNPYRYVATHGAIDLVRAIASLGPEGRGKLLAALPEMIPSLKRALTTNDPHTIVNVCKVLQALTTSDKIVAGALVPYYRQLLATLNLFKEKKRCTMDKTDWASGKRDGRTVGEIIEETLDLLQATGGRDAFVNIKYMVPTFDCVEPLPPTTASLL
jgi:hypothetical protein